jgi:TRAP-type mannitol/chloroaromatic compound transport system permease large subunit
VIKGTLDDPRITIGEIFRGAAPFALAMVFLLAVIALFPQIATILVK